MTICKRILSAMLAMVLLFGAVVPITVGATQTDASIEPQETAAAQTPAETNVPAENEAVTIPTEESIPATEENFVAEETEITVEETEPPTEETEAAVEETEPSTEETEAVVEEIEPPTEETESAVEETEGATEETAAVVEPEEVQEIPDLLAAAGEDAVSRARWIQSLVKTFSMTVEDNNYPDNYYSDLTGSEEYYRDILVAVEFGLIDQLPGTAFRPEKPASREFAAHTLNFALGYQLEGGTAYTFSEAGAVTYPDDIQIAINRGWFSLSGAAFLPAQAITAAESAAMLADAAKVLSGDVIDKNYTSTFVYAEGVVEIPDGTTVEFFGEDTVYITYCPKTIHAGDIFAVYNGGLPVIGIAQAVSESDGITTVIYTQGPDEALVDYDFQASLDADLEQFQGAEATTYTTRNGGIARAGAVTHSISYDKGKKMITANLPIELADGVEATISVKLSNLKIDSKAKLGQEVRCILSADTTLIAGVEVDYLKAAELPKSVTIGTVPVAGVGKITLSAEFTISGELVVTVTGKLRTGFSWTQYDGFRFICEYKRKSFHLSAEITIYAGLKLSAGVDLIAAEGNFYITLGDKTIFKVDYYEDGALPKNCRDEQSYTSSEAGYYVEVMWKTYHDSYTILGAGRSNPTYQHYHYEDDQLVDACTRGASSSEYYTPTSSKHFRPSSSSGRGSYTGSDGKPVVVYSYSLNEENEATITGYKGNASALMIPKTIDGYTVVGIGANAFSGNTNLHIVKFPNTVRVIGEKAFYNCTNLETVLLPGSLTTLHGRAFGNCPALEYIEIPKSLTTVVASVETPTYLNYYYGPFANSGLKRAVIEAGATATPNYLFDNCKELEYAQIPDTVTAIGGRMFYECTALKAVDLPNGITTIQNYTFQNCDSLTEITIPDTVTMIEVKAFYDCDALASVTLSENLTDLKGNAFGSCDALTTIHIPKALTTIYWDTSGSEFSPGGKFYYGPFTYSGLKKVTFEEGTEQIPAALFYQAQKLENVQMLDTITTIGGNAFYDCNALKQIVIPEGVTTIFANTFNGSGLSSIEIPDSVTTIHEKAFYDCADLETVKLSSSLTKLYGNAFGNCSSLKEIQIPKALTTVELTKSDSIYYGPFYSSGLEKATFEEGTVSVLPNLFYKAYNLKEISLLEGMTSIGKEAFFGCKSLNGVVIPSTVKTLENGAFHGCESLESIAIPSGVEKLPYYAFQDCAKLAAVDLPDTLTAIESSAFQNCDALASINLPDSLVTMGTEVFYDCDALESIVIPDNVESIKKNTFYSCNALKNVEFGAAITIIGASAFYNCEALESVAFNEAVTEIGASAFYNCDSLGSVQIGHNISNVGNSCFYDCDGLETVTFTAGTPTITLGDSIFSHCDTLKNVNLGFRIGIIPGKAFYECDALEEIVIPSNVTTIRANAFANCTQLKKVVTHELLTSIAANAFSYPKVTVFYGIAGSETQNYAETNGYPFVVNTVPATSLVLAKNEAEMLNGTYQRMDMTILPVDFADTITYKSSDPNVVTVSEYGVLRAVAGGTATIKVMVGDCSATCKITVKQPVTGINLNKNTVELNVSQTFRLTAAVVPEGANSVLLWSSDNEAVATVDQDGLVKAMGNGKAVITAAAQDGSGISASCTVTVIDPDNIPVSSITLDRESVTMESLQTYSLAAIVKPANAANKKLTWTSADETVATVDANGVITAVAKGSTIITASSTDGSGIHAGCTVTVTNNAVVVTDVSTFESEHSYAANSTDVWIYIQEGATEVHITFDHRTALEENFDFLYIYDAEGRQVGKYTGTELAGQTVTVPGDTVKIQLDTDDGGADWGFKVTDISADILHTHAYGDWVQTKAPNCTEVGEETRTCSCGTTETRPVAALEHDYLDGRCVRCGEVSGNPVVTRIAGRGRCQTALESAKQLKALLKVDKFNTIVLADAANFPDALSGSYLAAAAEAPILLYLKGQTAVTEYIKENLAADGTVYILGGTNSVSDEVEAALTGIRIQRIAGSGRYVTSLDIIKMGDAILDRQPEKLLVCTGLNFADSLSASATGLPILLVNGGATELRGDHEAYLKTLSNTQIFVIGGGNSVSEAMLKALESYDADGTVKRVSGSGRAKTSVEVAREFFPDAKAATLALSTNFPDGLSGGPVAYTLEAPLLLISAGQEAAAAAYVADKGITEGYVFGGESSVSDRSITTVFGTDDTSR